jgi:hypothetical protein
MKRPFSSRACPRPTSLDAALLEGQVLLDSECLLALHRGAMPGSGLADAPAVPERLCQPGEQLPPFGLGEISDETVDLVGGGHHEFPSQMDIAFQSKTRAV